MRQEEIDIIKGYRKDIEFDDGPVEQGIVYAAGKVQEYILTFEGKTVCVSRERDARGDYCVIEDAQWTLRVPMPIIEAMMRLDLAALVPMAAEAKEEE